MTAQYLLCIHILMSACCSTVQTILCLHSVVLRRRTVRSTLYSHCRHYIYGPGGLHHVCFLYGFFDDNFKVVDANSLTSLNHKITLDVLMSYDRY